MLGLLNPFYTSQVLARLNTRVLSIGSFLLSCLPFMVAFLLGARKWQLKLFKKLPWILAVEFVLTALSGLLITRTLAGYYLVNTAIFGLLNTMILCLMQRVKARRYRGLRRAAFERRYLAADALGYGLGSLLVMSGLVAKMPLPGLAVLAVAQIAVLEVTYLIAYRAG